MDILIFSLLGSMYSFILGLSIKVLTDCVYIKICDVYTYLDFDDKLGSDIFRRFLRWLRVCVKRSLYDSDRFTETGADFDFALCVYK